MLKKVLILGCTGSIGTSAIDVVNQFPDKYVISGLSAHNSKEKLQDLSNKYNCPFCLSSESGISGLNQFINENDADIVVNGIAGSAGLYPSAAALQSGKNLALANKETIVMAGSIIKAIAKENKCQILPVDSEHSAVFNLIERIGKKNISRIILTASGGPFRNYTQEQLTKVTLKDALNHPTWKMGKKITIDSATLANKGLEVIEACSLFDMPSKKVDVAVHPQSIVHSLVRTNDSVLYAQMSLPDMRHPILSALSWPDFIQNNMKPLDICPVLDNELTLTFSKPRLDDFPMLKLAYKVSDNGSAYPIAYNAANEIAVDAFIKGKISFLDIAGITEKVLQKDWNVAISSIEDVFEIDKKARSTAELSIC